MDFNHLKENALENLKDNSIWINGRWIIAGDCPSYPIYNPVTQEVLFKCSECNQYYVNKAVEAARNAFKNSIWADMPLSERGNILFRIAELIEKYSDKLAYLESLNTGKPIVQAKNVDIQATIDTFRYYAGWADKFSGDIAPVKPQYINIINREPVGVVGQIVPWNFPLNMATWKIAPAIAMGNAVVLKPSEQTPLTALILMEILKESNLPDGIVNLVTGGGSTGELITRHNDIDKIAFTGSRKVATSIIKASAETNLKTVTLELGGKSPQIILEDIKSEKLDDLVEAIYWGIYLNQGEVCVAGSRLIIHRNIKDIVLAKLIDKINKIGKIGDPLCEETNMGAMITKEHYERVMKYIQKGIDEGAQLVIGGKRKNVEGFENGYFIEHTIFDNVTKDMAIAKEEIFGPVLAIMVFDTIEEAVMIANATIYGLTSSVWCSDISKALSISKDLRTGTVWINHYNSFDCSSPHGGCKESGWGRDLGKYALNAYTVIKSIWLPVEKYK